MNTPNAILARRPAVFALGSLLALLTFFAVAPPARAANPNPPGKMTFQGFLTDTSSPPVPLGNSSPENKTVIFKIYKSATGTANSDVVWAESQVVTVDKGHFSVLLGEGSAVTGFTDKHPTDLSSVFIGADASDRWIGLTVDGTEMTPRIQFFAAPYAHMARAPSSLINPVSGATILNLANGKLEGAAEITATGSITSSGSVAGLIFANRNGSGAWQWYAQDGTARLWQSVSGFGDRLAVTSDGKFGIGTSTPAATLHVNGTARIEGANALEFGGGVSGKEANAGKIGYATFTTGALDIVGAGTSTRVIKLWDNVTVGGNLSVGGQSTSLDIDGKLTVTDGTRNYPAGISTELGAGILQFGLNEGTGNRFGTANTAAQGGMFRFDTRSGEPAMSIFTRPASDNSGAGAQRFVVLGNGNVGIGTTTPAATLHVNGSARLESGARIEGNSVLEFGGGVSGKEQNAGKMGYQIFTTGMLDIAGAGASTRAIRLWDTVTVEGNLGIGTTTPAARLHINGGARIEANSILEFGGGLTKSSAAGKIGYAPFSSGALEIVGAGTDDFNRVVRLYDRVGIGTSSPEAPLHVAGSVSKTYNAEAWGNTGGWADLGNQLTSTIGGTALKTQAESLGVIVDNTIRAAMFVVNSDERLKRILGPSPTSADLATLRKIQITDFTFKDTINHGGRAQKKVIAQQIEQVYPPAVSVGQGVVTDIFQKAGMEAGWIVLATDLKVGERVRLIADKHDGVHEVLEVQPGRFRTEFIPKDDKVFVYRRAVDDFRSVDYDAIAMLNVSATQELARQVDALKKSEARIAELEQKTARIAELEAKAARVDSLERKVEELTKLVADLAPAQAEQRVSTRKIAAAKH